MSPGRIVCAAGWTAVVLVMSAVLALLLIPDPRWSVAALVGDDAGYYFHLVRNLCLGYGFSFDRLEPTNGFNPLVPWLLYGPYRAFGPEPPVLACYRVGAALGWVAVVIGLAAFAHLALGMVSRDSGDGRDALVGAAAGFFALFVATKGYYGMDAPLVLALGCGYLVRVRRGGVLAPGWGAAAADGGLLALAFLARVDTLPLVAAAFVLMAVAARERHGRWTDLFLRACVFVALAAPYLVVGERRFGSWVPISARLKSAFPRLDPVQSLAAIRGTSLNPADQASFLVALVLALGVCVAWLPGLMAAPSTRRSGAARVGGRDGVLLLLAMYLVLRLGYMLLFSRYDVQGSYAILAHVFNVLVALRAVDAVGHPGGKALAPRLRLLGASALLGLGLLLFSGKVLTTTDRWRRMVTGAGLDDATIGRAIATATGRHDVLYGGAFGIAGFFADRAWINGDGVINTLAYQEALRDRRLNDYLAARHVNRVVFVTDRRTGPYAVAVRSGLFGTSDTLRVTAGTEQARFPTLRAGGGEVVLAVWEPKNAPERALRAAARVVHARGADGDGGSHLSR